MPVTLEMALLLLLFGSFWVQGVNPETQSTMSLLTSTPGGPPASTVSGVSEALKLSSEISSRSMTRDSEEVNSTRGQLSNPPTPITFRDNEMPLVGTSTGAAPGLPIPESTTSQEISTGKSSVLPQASNATRDPAVTRVVNSSLEYPTVTSGAVTFETSSVTNRLPVALATSSLGTSKETTVPLVPMATSSLEPYDETKEPPVTMATGSLEPYDETKEPPVTMATGSLEPYDETKEPPVTMATGSLEPYDETKEPPVTMATGSLEPSDETGEPPVILGTSDVARGSPVSRMETSTLTTPRSPSSTGLSPSASTGTQGMLLVPLLVALLVVIALLSLLLLWRRRQKRRTGILTLSGGGKRNGVVDAWAGPARVPDEEAATAIVGGSGGSKGSGADPEGPGQRPALSTFFSRRKSRRGSLALEELKTGSGPSLKAEEEPLVGSEDEAAEAPTSNGPGLGDAAAPSSL